MYRIDELEAIKKQDAAAIATWLEDKLVSSQDEKFARLKCGACGGNLETVIHHPWFGRFYCSKKCAVQELKEVMQSETIAEHYKREKESDLELRSYFKKGLCKEENKNPDTACCACQKKGMDAIVHYSSFPYSQYHFCSEECAISGLIDMYFALVYS